MADARLGLRLKALCGCGEGALSVTSRADLHPFAYIISTNALSGSV